MSVQKGPDSCCAGNLQTSITTGEMAERASDSRIPPWIELPSDIWGLIGSHLGPRDFARASTVIKVLCGFQPVALNLAHNLTDINKLGELLWGLKRSSRVLCAVIELGRSRRYLVKLSLMMPLRIRSFPNMQELSLDLRSDSSRFCLPALDETASAFGMSLLAQMAQLQVLQLEVPELVPLPDMPCLRHLKIVHYEQGGLYFEGAVESVAALPALQTLYAQLVHPNGCYPLVVNMDLRKCASLQAVCLVGMVPNEALVPPAAKLTVDTDLTVLGLRRHPVLKAQGLRLRGQQQLGYLTQRVDFCMLSALSLRDLRDGGSVNIHLGMWDNASQLRFLSVTCITGDL